MLKAIFQRRKIMRPARRWPEFLIMALFLLTNAGCAAFIAAGAGAGVGIGAAEYIRGELKQVYAAPMEKAWQASLAAAEELKMTVTERSIEQGDKNRLIKGKTAQGKDFKITLEANSPEVTTVLVRIGIFGDEAYSRKIQEAIANNLKK
ncbi:MAG: DUF3568 family protein [Thermodesulfobacteriota bacterium]